MTKTHRQTGFTLVELMIVVAILAILAAVAIVAYTKWVQSARESEAHSILADIRIKQEAYRASFRQYAGRNANWDGWAPAKTNPTDTPVFWDDEADAAADAAWAQLGLTPTGKHLFFRYYIEAGPPGQAATLFPASLPTDADFWFAARAVHDLRNSGECEGFEIYSMTNVMHKVPAQGNTRCP